ncbi:MAG: site-specific integrase [Bacteroidota bacterium]
MEQTFGLHFFLRKSRKKNNDESMIFIRITVDGVSREVSTKRKCMPQKWGASYGRLLGKTEEAKSINAYLDTYQQKIFEAKRKLLERDTELTAENIKAVMLGVDIYHQKHMLMDVFAQHNLQVKELVGKEFALATYIRFETTIQHTKKFLFWKYKIHDIDIRKINYELIAEFEFWFKSVRNTNHNTAMKYLGNFRKIINRCLKNGWLPKDPFIGFKMAKKEVERHPLNENELQKIIEKSFAVPRLDLVKDIFLFSCYTGLAYIDVKRLNDSDIVVGSDNCEWLITKRQKTNTSARIPLLPVAKDILNKYATFSKNNNGKVLLPALTNQKMNAYLKEIADNCGIQKRLTFHIARHTFATTITLSNGVPIETVSKMLGHKDIRTTQLYAKIIDKKIGDDMKWVRQKYSGSD